MVVVQTDWVGVETPDERVARRMRDTRDSVADQKARLSLRLHRLCQYCPQTVRDGDVFKTREWVARQASAKKVAAKLRASAKKVAAKLRASAKKVAAKLRASANELQMAVSSLEGYLNASEIERFAR